MSDAKNGEPLKIKVTDPTESELLRITIPDDREILRIHKDGRFFIYDEEVTGLPAQEIGESLVRVMLGVDVAREVPSYLWHCLCGDCAEKVHVELRKEALRRLGAQEEAK